MIADGQIIKRFLAIPDCGENAGLKIVGEGLVLLQIGGQICQQTLTGVDRVVHIADRQNVWGGAFQHIHPELELAAVGAVTLVLNEIFTTLGIKFCYSGGDVSVSLPHPANGKQLLSGFGGG